MLGITTSSRLPPNGLPPYISGKRPATWLNRGMGRYSGILRRTLLNSTSAGFLTVCLAGTLTHTLHHTYATPSSPLPPSPPKRLTHTLRVSLLTCFTFILLGGTLQSTSPSSLFSPGAYARTSIPAPSSAYSTPSQKLALISIYRRHGCHTCGTRNKLTKVIGDHVPPNVVVRAIGGKKDSMKQVFLPQCQNCSSKQGSALTRSLLNGKWMGVGKNSLMHFRPRAFWLAGSIVANAGDWKELEDMESRAENFALRCAHKISNFVGF